MLKRIFYSRTSCRRDYDARLRFRRRSLLQEKSLARSRFRHGHSDFSRDIRWFRSLVQCARYIPVYNKYHDLSNGLGGRADLSFINDSLVN